MLLLGFLIKNEYYKKAKRLILPIKGPYMRASGS